MKDPKCVDELIKELQKNVYNVLSNKGWINNLPVAELINVPTLEIITEEILFNGQPFQLKLGGQVLFKRKIEGKSGGTAGADSMFTASVKVKYNQGLDKFEILTDVEDFFWKND